MQIIIGAILGIFIGIIFMGLMATNRVGDLIFERDWYKKVLRDEKIKTEQRDILIRDLIKKESVNDRKSTTNS